tara:strand:- start:13374 stop:13628 length:255 start_codon:yes stop_codon:yes gene_type:complete
VSDNLIAWPKQPVRIARAVSVIANRTTGNGYVFLVSYTEDDEIYGVRKFTAISKTALYAVALSIKHECPVIAHGEAGHLFAEKL